MSSQAQLQNPGELQVVLVGGYRQFNSKESVRKNLQESCWEFFSYLNDKGMRSRSKFLDQMHVIVNDGRILTKIEPKNVTELLDFLYVMDTERNGISVVIIAHSLGAKVVYEALKSDTLVKYLKRKGVLDIEARIKTIRSHLAVFAVGVVEDIPMNRAQICVNINLDKDRKANMAKFLFGDNHNEKCEKVILGVGAEISQEKKTRSSMSNFLSSASASAASTSASDSSNDNHCLVKYTQCIHLMQLIAERINEYNDLKKARKTAGFEDYFFIVLFTVIIMAAFCLRQVWSQCL